MTRVLAYFYNRFLNALRRPALFLQIPVGRISNKSEVQNFLASLSAKIINIPLVRIGGQGDGGYLIPDDLDGIKFCFSPGVSSLASFEADLLKRNVVCFLADWSVEGPPIISSNIKFIKKFVGPSSCGNFIGINDWIAEELDSRSDQDYIIQMDIEGSEFETLLAMNDEYYKRCRILVLEIHDLDCIYDASGFKLIKCLFNKLNSFFELVHIHPNNCQPPFKFRGLSVHPVMEFTFIRKDRVRVLGERRDFPHILDMKNVVDRPDEVLPLCWGGRSD